MFKQLFIFLFLIINTYATYICRTPLDCDVYCNNISTKKINQLKKTNWIPVLWDNGDCYFYNTITQENRENYPFIFLRKNKFSYFKL